MQERRKAHMRPITSIRRICMKDGEKQTRTPSPERMQALRSLPKETVASFTRDELEAFLFSDTWPASLAEKLKQYQI
jgi:hypothetical protein